MTTPHQSKYWALELTTAGQYGSISSLTRSISNARVDLNPHQVNAALFGLKSPISKGAILADEVGLGKTIEAGLVLSQKWAERKRKILLIVPATLRKQWQQELEEKFFLPSIVIESMRYKKLKQSGHRNPFAQSDFIVICSYHFARSKQDDISAVDWDLSVIDEAHRLRNVYKPNNKIAASIKESLQDVPKLLLTATPLQNSLMELFGLVSIIDDYIFGDKLSFRAQFVGKMVDEETRNKELKARLDSICIRALRRQVTEYVRFTSRTSITEEFTPTDEEHALYERMSVFLQRETLASLPNAQRKLMTLVLRKLLASSTFAIGATLKKLLSRLEKDMADLNHPNALEHIKKELSEENDAVQTLGNEFETIVEVQEEWGSEPVELNQTDIDELKTEINDEMSELRGISQLADKITNNTKGDALLRALSTAFTQTQNNKAKKKAVIFTESRKTQDYLFKLLNENGYATEVVTMNGTNTDAASKNIYSDWQERHRGEHVLSGAKAVDIKAAIVEEFKDRATILVATEAAAEGMNLQFCSLVVNYDLPWNPQRIEQRIGRCHRYGQKHDVVVVNFLNRRNAADQRVFELLSEKFRLFDGVFGASDEILGTLESGIDIEKRIADLYQSCRTETEITDAFDHLQHELDDQIQSRMFETRQAVLENFDEEVHERLKMNHDKTRSILDQRQRWLLDLAQFELGTDCEVFETNNGFKYTGEILPQGNYWLRWEDAQAKGGTFYRIESNSVTKIIEKSLSRSTDQAHLEFKLSSYAAKISILEQLSGQSGLLALSILKASSMKDEYFLILSGTTDSGEIMDTDCCRKLMSVPSRLLDKHINIQPSDSLKRSQDIEINKHLAEVKKRNGSILTNDMTKVNKWAEDQKYAFEQEQKNLDVEIRQVRKASILATSLEDKLAKQRQVKSLEQKRNTRRRQMYDFYDQIDEKCDVMINKIVKQMKIERNTENVFIIRWTLIE